MRYDKLIRDLVPQAMDAKGVRYTLHAATDQEYRDKLSQKLQEEVDEYLAGMNPEELADIQEVILALGKTHGLDPAGLESIRLKKLNDRGGFNDRIILEQTYDGQG